MLEDSKDEVEWLLFNLSALADLGEEVASFNEFQRVIKSSLYLVMGTFSVSKGVIFQFDPVKKELSHMVSRGLGDINDARVSIDDKARRQMIKINKPFCLDGMPSGLRVGEDAFLERIKADLVIPIVAKGELLGVMTLGKRLSEKVYSKNDHSMLSMMSRQIALSLHSHSLLQRLSKKTEDGNKEKIGHIYYGTIHALSATIDAKDAYTKGHSHRVASYCEAVARELGWSNNDIEGLGAAGLLHDIGKVAVEKSIINKASSLTTEEVVELNRHPVIGYEILSRAKFPWEGIPLMVRNHHEKINGRGYPDGLMGYNIMPGARIMALTDAFDAMTTDRPYRMHLPLEAAIMEIKKHLNNHFDLEAANAFFSTLKKEVRGEIETPIILPCLHGPIDKVKVGGLLEGLAAHI